MSLFYCTLSLIITCHCNKPWIREVADHPHLARVQRGLPINNGSVINWSGLAAVSTLHVCSTLILADLKKKCTGWIIRWFWMPFRSMCLRKQPMESCLCVCVNMHNACVCVYSVAYYKEMAKGTGWFTVIHTLQQSGWVGGGERVLQKAWHLEVREVGPWPAAPELSWISWEMWVWTFFFSERNKHKSALSVCLSLHSQ